MKRLLLFLSIFTSYITTIDETFKNPIDQDSENNDLEQQIKIQEERLASLRAKRKPRILDSNEILTDRQSSKTSRLDFTEYNREDTLELQKRTTYDKTLKENWGKEDKFAQEIRDNEGFWVRLTKKTTADSATDSEIEQTRNKRILELNRERIFKDFETKAKRFEDLKNTYPEFCEKKPWNSLLELGDMNKFMTMSPSDRENLIRRIEEQTQSILQEHFTINNDDVPALQDMMRLSNSSQLPEPSQDLFKETLTAEFSEKTSDEQKEIVNQLKKMLQASLHESIEQLKKYNTAMEAIKHDINSLDHARTMKNVGNAAFWILGTAAGVCMLGHGAMVVEGVSITMEKFAIGAKAGLAAGHIGAHTEAELSKHIQTQFKNIIEPLLPKTTTLLETITYKNQAKSLTERLREKISKMSDAAKNKISMETRNNISNKLNAIKDSISKTIKSGRESSLNKTLNQGFDKVSDQARKGLKATKDAAHTVHEKITTSNSYQQLMASLNNVKKALSKNSDTNSDDDNSSKSEEALKKYQEFNPALGYSTKEQN